LLLLLGLPTLGLAFGISVITTYGPVVLFHLAHSGTKVGVLIGSEGAFALVIPIMVGRVSDRLPPSGLGRRMPFVIAGAPFLIAGLVLLPFSSSYLGASLILFGFFLGYFLYYPPYRTLYADLFPRSAYARIQSSQAIARGLGLGSALLAGGLLLAVWQPLPFVIGAVVIAATTFALVPVIRLEADKPLDDQPRRSSSLWRLLRCNGRLRAFAVANGLWEFSFTGMRSFIVLYVIKGLSESAAVASLVIAVVAVAAVLAAPVAGRLAGRYGIVPVMRLSIVVCGGGLVLGVFADSLTPILIGLPVVALAGATAMTLPQALAFTLADDADLGAAAGLQDFSRGIGVVLGPIVVGAAIDLFRGPFPATHGYAAMWPAVGIPILASLLLLGPMTQKDRGNPDATSTESPAIPTGNQAA